MMKVSCLKINQVILPDVLLKLPKIISKYIVLNKKTVVNSNKGIIFRIKEKVLFLFILSITFSNLTCPYLRDNKTYLLSLKIS